MKHELETPMKIEVGGKEESVMKPFFRLAKDDTKPLLQDPILRSDPIQTEEAVLRLPPLPDCLKSKLLPQAIDAADDD